MDVDLIISLGGRCQVAHQVRRRFPTLERAHFFDWLMAPLSSVQKVIESNFSGFEDESAWTVHPSNRSHFDHKHLMHQPYGLLSTHDFDNSKDLSEAFPAAISKFAFLASRWRDLAKARKRILFIHQVITSPPSEGTQEVQVTNAEAKSFMREIIEPCFGPSAFFLLITDDKSYVEIQSNNVYSYYIKQPSPWRWQGNDSDWDRMWDHYNVRLDDAHVRSS